MVESWGRIAVAAAADDLYPPRSLTFAHSFVQIVCIVFRVECVGTGR